MASPPRPAAPVRRRAAIAVLAAMAMAATNVHAQEDGFKPSFSFSGFGTLGIAHSSEKEADFVAHDLQGGGAGRDHEWSSDVDTRLGLQLTAHLTEKFTAVVQVLTEQRYDGTYRPGLEWANLKYDVTPDFSVRAGRIVLPTFLTSDTRKVGYAQPWVRPPVELYSLMPVTSSDGVDVTYRLRLGEASHNLKFAYGGTDERIPDGGKVKVRDGWLIANTIEYGAATFHVAYSRSKVTIELYDQLFGGYRDIAAGASQVAAGFPPFMSAEAAEYRAAAAHANAIADKYSADNRRMSFLGLGASYDPGNWFVMGEWGQTDHDSVFGKRQAWYVTTGLRWGNFTPYVSYARAKRKSDNSRVAVDVPPGFAPPDLLAGAALANAALNEELNAAPVQKTISLGVRWDFAKNAAFKLQYDHSDISGNSPGTLDHLTDRFRPGGRFDVWSATVDFVF